MSYIIRSPDAPHDCGPSLSQVRAKRGSWEAKRKAAAEDPHRKRQKKDLRDRLPGRPWNDGSPPKAGYVAPWDILSYHVVDAKKRKRVRYAYLIMVRSISSVRASAIYITISRWQGSGMKAGGWRIHPPLEGSQHRSISRY